MTETSRPIIVGPHREIAEPEDFFGPDVVVHKKPLQWTKTHLQQVVWYVRQSAPGPGRGRTVSNSMTLQPEETRMLRAIEVAYNERTEEYLFVAGFVDPGEGA